MEQPLILHQFALVMVLALKLTLANAVICTLVKHAKHLFALALMVSIPMSALAMVFVTPLILVLAPVVITESAVSTLFVTEFTIIRPQYVQEWVIARFLIHVFASLM